MSKRGDVFENRVTGERSVIIQGTEGSPDGTIISELHVRPGGAVVGEHLHKGIDERLTVLSGRLGVSINGKRRIATAGEAIEVPAGVVHDWWNAGDEHAHVLVEVSPGQRFEEMICTFWGLANAGRTNKKGMPGLLQLVLSGHEFEDVVTFTRPPQIIQRSAYRLLAPLARRKGLRGSYYPEYRHLIEVRGAEETAEAAVAA